MLQNTLGLKLREIGLRLLAGTAGNVTSFSYTWVYTAGTEYTAAFVRAISPNITPTTSTGGLEVSEVRFQSSDTYWVDIFGLQSADAFDTIEINGLLFDTSVGCTVTTIGSVDTRYQWLGISAVSGTAIYANPLAAGGQSATSDMTE